MKSNLRKKRKIGSLSIRGAARADISAVDMNILHEMSFWASGILDAILQQRSLELAQKLLCGRERLVNLIDMSRDTEDDSAEFLTHALSVVCNSMNSSFALLLRINSETIGYFMVMKS